MRSTVTFICSGSVQPAPLQARWLHDGKEMTGNIEFPTFFVASLLSVKDGEKVDPSQFRDIIGEIDIVGPFNWWPWAAGAVALVAAALAAYFLLRARPKPPIAPDAWALGAFARLEDAALPAKAEYGRYYDELTGIVRHYVAMRYAIPAQQQTSREFMDSTRTHAEFPAQEAEPLRNLLRLADQVKFAKAEPTRAECDANLIAARELVRQTLLELPERSREILGLRAEGFSYIDISSAMLISPGSVGTLLARAERAFRVAYEARRGGM